MQYSCCSETGENDAGTGDGNSGTINNPSTNQIPRIGISNFQKEEVKQEGWTFFSFIARYLPPATLSGGSFVAPLAEVVVHIEYISASMGNASHAAVMPKNRSYLTKVMQAAAMAPMYGLARPSQGAVARRMRTKAGY